MGTLTGSSDRLPSLCDHKLPTSCRLSSIPNCCACADERAHSATYRTYIDGIGYVPRGTRWQRYCWFCKEFWENRVAATSLTPEQTRIPDFPEQTDFLKRWYEFHRGYRVVSQPDGTERRSAVMGEPWPDVAPGKLPRTLDELRSGEVESQADLWRVITVTAAPQAEGPSIEDALDDLLAEADDVHHEQGVAEAGSTPQATATTQDAVQATARDSELQEEVNCLLQQLQDAQLDIRRISQSLRSHQEPTPVWVDSPPYLASLESYIQAAQRQHAQTRAEHPASGTGVVPGTGSLEDRIAAASTAITDEAQLRQLIWTQRTQARYLAQEARGLQTALEEHDAQVALNVRLLKTRLERLRAERRAAETFRRVFGSREDMERDDYVSPIGGMFDRADARAAAADRDRRSVPADDDAAAASRLADMWTALSERHPPEAAPGRQQQLTTLVRDLHAVMERSGILDGGAAGAGPSLDADESRPAPREDGELTVRMDCRVCFTQLAEVACLPCGHVIMCRWCSEQHCPGAAGDRTRPARRATCPLCRRVVKQKVRVRIA